MNAVFPAPYFPTTTILSTSFSAELSLKSIKKILKKPFNLINDYDSFRIIMNDLINENDKLRNENEKYLSIIKSLGIRLTSKENESLNNRRAFCNIKKENQLIKDEINYLNNQIKELNCKLSEEITQQRRIIDQKDEKIKIAMQIIGELYNENQSLLKYLNN